jgi:citrate synthase
MSKVLFEVTEDHLETGLRGYPVGYCTTSTVDPQKGLFYVGRSVKDLALCKPEEVIYLLYFGQEGNPQEIATFFSDLKERSSVSPDVTAAVSRLPRTGHPMQLLEAATTLLAMFESTGNYREDGLNLIAKLPTLVATLINAHAGWKETPPSNPSLGYMENFAHMLQVPGADKGKLFQAFKLFNILHYDHGGGNLSTFVGKAVASGLADMYGSMTAAFCALAGPKHGKANQDCLQFVREVLKEVGDKPNASQVEQCIRKRLSNNQLVFGFGHAVLRVEDPRATLMYDFLKEHYPSSPLVQLALLLRSEGSKVLSENPKISNPHPNVDAISGVMLAVAGFDYPEYFTVLFGLSRAVGISRQIIYERCEARGGKGTPIVRPKYIYKSNA